MEEEAALNSSSEAKLTPKSDERRVCTPPIEDYRPLVYSVCRRYLRDRDDVEDAAQETFLKFAANAALIRGSVPGWLSATACSTSVDLIRRTARERRRREKLGEIDPAWHAQHRVLHESIDRRLREALLELDQQQRDLIIGRFVKKMPLRALATDGMSVATTCRRVAAALKALAALLRDMGVASVDDLTLAEHFGADGLDPEHHPDADADGLRFAPDWKNAEFRAVVNPGLQLEAGTSLPGWTRPIRVGMLVSYLSATSPISGPQGPWVVAPIEWQVAMSRQIARGGIELVGTVEPGTSGHPLVERTLRDFELLGGLIDSTDVRGLQTLDVIILGCNYGITDATARAVAEAVRSGVGLFNEYWLANVGNADVRQLLLATSPVYEYHSSPCGIPMPATVHEAHPMLPPTLSPGAGLSLRSCGPIYKVSETARVLITKDRLVLPEEHGIPGVGTLRPPGMIVDQLGRGRVIVFHGAFPDFRDLAARAVGRDYMTDVLGWLAEPRREASA